jgi:glycosyltransferase involved in cell wall biosynthesis
MKAAIFNPYWDTLGGGERYTILFAKVLSDLGYRVDLEWNNENILEKIQDRFGIKINNIRVVECINKGEGYDLCFWVSDGSIPLLHSRNNLLHFQVPFKDINGKTLLNKMKLFRVKKIICNSNFTKTVIDREFGVNSVVIYPPCEVSKVKPKRKENIILNVGRFSQLLQSKRQDVLAKAFVRLTKSGLVDWRLIFVGGIDVGVSDYLHGLKKISKGYPVEFIESPPHKVLWDLYGRSKIFWSASGFGENEIKDSEKVEHFGIAVVESMAAGCIPVIYDAGGHKEIISSGSNGFLWKKVPELVKITKTLISDRKYSKALSREAIRISKSFSYENFAKNVEKILNQY